MKQWSAVFCFANLTANKLLIIFYNIFYYNLLHCQLFTTKLNIFGCSLEMRKDPVKCLRVTQATTTSTTKLLFVPELWEQQEQRERRQSDALKEIKRPAISSQGPPAAQQKRGANHSAPHKS